MRCQQDLLELYIDNRLNEAARTEVEVHIGECSRCLKELERLQLVVEMLQTCEPPDPDINFCNDIMIAIEAEPSPLEIELKRRQRVGRFLGFGSSILAVGLLIVVLTVFRGYLGAVVWDGIIWLWDRIALGTLPDIDILSIWQSIKNLVDIVTDVLEGNQFLMPVLVVSGLLVVSMAGEIVDDVQRVLGYRE